MKPWRKQLRTQFGSTRWQSLPMLTRGVARELMMWCDDDGLIELDEGDPCSNLWRLVGAHPRERKTLGRHLSILLDRGTCEWVSGGLLFAKFPSYQDLDRPSKAQKRGRGDRTTSRLVEADAGTGRDEDGAGTGRGRGRDGARTGRGRGEDGARTGRGRGEEEVEAKSPESLNTDRREKEREGEEEKEGEVAGKPATARTPARGLPEEPRLPLRMDTASVLRRAWSDAWERQTATPATRPHLDAVANLAPWLEDYARREGVTGSPAELGPRLIEAFFVAKTVGKPDSRPRPEWLAEDPGRYLEAEARRTADAGRASLTDQLSRLEDAMDDARQRGALDEVDALRAEMHALCEQARASA